MIMSNNIKGLRFDFLKIHQQKKKIKVNKTTNFKKKGKKRKQINIIWNEQLLTSLRFKSLKKVKLNTEPYLLFLWNVLYQNIHMMDLS